MLGMASYDEWGQAQKFITHSGAEGTFDAFGT
ncbi:MAG: hypothetical protein ACI8QC_003005, partial [Planctomycetota bacterium]